MSYFEKFQNSSAFDGEGDNIYLENLRLKQQIKELRKENEELLEKYTFSVKLFSEAEEELRKKKNENKELIDENLFLKKENETDFLTGVKNRRRIKNKDCFNILGDIDNFKKFNDEFGHDFGDEVLKGFAENLRKFVREDDIVRLGGDEFVILLEDFDQEKDAEAFASRLIEKIQKIVVFNKDTKEYVEVGVSLAFGKSIDTADQNMYKKKKERKESLSDIYKKIV